jgi:hypothetical protein
MSLIRCLGAAVCVHSIILACGCATGKNDIPESAVRSNPAGSVVIIPDISFAVKEASDFPPPPCIVETLFPTEDHVVADVLAVRPLYDIDSSGAADSTGAINAALLDCADLGGGTVWLPPGTYLVRRPLYIPPFVTLRGDWQDPDEGTSYGTVILARPESADDDKSGLINIGGSAGVIGITVFYPEQDITYPKPYPFTFYISGAGPGNYMDQAVVNCTVINGYRGIGASTHGGQIHEMLTVENFKGTFLKSGAEVYNGADVDVWKNISIDEKYWALAGGGMACADNNALTRYLRSGAEGLILGDIEWGQYANISVRGCKTGVRAVKGKRAEFSGVLFNFNIRDCGVGLQIDSIDKPWGMVIAGSFIEGSEASIVNKTRGAVKLTDVVLKGKTKGSGIMKLRGSPGDMTAGYFQSPPKPPGNLYVAGADTTGAEDAAQAVQAILDEAGRGGGGVVYLPAGRYLLTRPLTVPAHTELRGSSSVPSRDQRGLSKGTLFLVRGDFSGNPDTDQALITLAGQGSGIRGIRLFYPDNNPLTAFRQYPYAIRGLSSYVYAVNLCITAAYNGIDFRGCEKHLIRKVSGVSFNNMFAAGGACGQIEGCLQNMNAVVRNGLLIRGWPQENWDTINALIGITQKTSEVIRLEDASGEFIFNCFTYGAKSLVVSKNSRNVRIINVGADNIGGPLLKVSGGDISAVNIQRYNGTSYEVRDGGRLGLYNRITVDDKREPNIEAAK